MRAAGLGYLAGLRFLNGDPIHFKRARGGAIERNHCLRIGPFRGNFGGLRLCQIGLILNHKIIGCKADVKCYLFYFYRLLLENTALNSGVIQPARACCPIET